MGERMYRMEHVAFYDRCAMERRLEEMAAKGWMLEKAGACFWRYRRTEPKRLHVTVTYFPEASEYDPGPTAGQEEFRELCARDGWEFAVQWGQMQVFYNERENPTPIETDPVVQVETIHRAMRRTVLPGNLLEVGLGIYLMLFALWKFRRDPVGFLASSWEIFYLPIALLITLAGAGAILMYFRWTQKAPKAAERGEMPELRTHRGLSILYHVILICCMAGMFLGSRVGRMGLLAGVVLVVMVLFTGQTVTKWMKQQGASRRKNLAVSIGVVLLVDLLLMGGLTALVFHTDLLSDIHRSGNYELMSGTKIPVYQEELPLRVEDLMEVPEDLEWSLEKHEKESFLAAQYDYWQWPLSQEDLPDLRYQVSTIQIPALYDFCQESALNAADRDEVRKGEVLLVDHYEPIDAAPWGVEKAYQLRWGNPEAVDWLPQYLLMDGGRIVELDLREEPTATQRSVMVQRLFDSRTKS